MMNPSRISRTLFVIISLIVVVYTVMYTWHDYTTLSANYSGESSTFYHESTWQTDFFKPSTKAFGHVYLMILSLLMVLTSALLWVFSSNNSFEAKKIRIKSDHIVVAAISMLLWLYFVRLAPYAYDEVFSAFHFAESSPWIALSHYPLPNNHVLFNVLNAIFFKISGIDALITGRFLSCIFFVLSSIIIYELTGYISNNRFERILLILLSITALPILGFATQARGYSLIILAVLSAFYALLNGLGKNLLLFAISVWIGMCVMPSFLYFWIGLSLATIWLHNNDGQLILRWLKYSWILLLMILAFYAPIVTFSGWPSLLENKYVKPANGNLFDFFNGIPGYWQGLSNEWFMTLPYGSIGVVLIIVLCFVLYLQNDKLRDIAKTMISMIVGTFCVIVAMQKLPFYRNLSPFAPLMWIGLGAVLILASAKIKTFGQTIFVMLSLSILGWKLHTFSGLHPNNLYYYDVVGTYKQQMECLKSQRLDQCIVIDDDAFYMSALIKRADKFIPTYSYQDCILIIPDEKLVSSDSTKIIHQCGGYTWLKK